MTELDAEPNVAGYSSQKRRLLLLLKTHPGASLGEVAGSLQISKVAALRHLTALEEEGLVAREYRSGGVGRPSAHFRLRDASAGLFPQAYTQMSLSALEYIERRLGHPAVVDLLQQRTDEVAATSGARFRSGELPERVRTLVQLRTEGGYMAELGSRQRGTVEMREHNCPILAIAGRYPEACEVERRMFERLLRARVEVSHRVVAGDAVCRFLVRPRREPA